METGLLVVYTGEYFKYFEKFWQTFNNFCGGQARLYVFTDRKASELPNDKRIVRIPTNHFDWPIMPLLRWHLVDFFRDYYQEDYLYLIDGDVYFKDKVIANAIKGELVGTLHRNIERSRKDFNYETRKESTAHIPDDLGEKYFCGGFVGGKREEFLKMAKRLKNNIQKDIDNGIRAVWGDESHINRYFVDHAPTEILSPEYMCPEGNDKFKQRIVHIHKDFKKMNKADVEKHTTINSDDYNVNFDGRYILVTGSDGFIGSRLMEYLEGYNVIGIDYKRGQNLWNCELPEVDVVIHLAAQSGAIPSMKNPWLDAKQNILTTIRLLKNYPKSKFIFTTTGAAVEPENPYGLSKKTAEEYIKLLHDNYVICRLSSVYGGKDRGVVDSFINEDPVVYGDGEAERDFVHVHDIVRGLAKSIEWEPGEYTMGSGVGTKVKDLAEATGKEIEYKPAREGEKERVVLENTTPDWEPKINVIKYIYDRGESPSS